MERPDEFPVEPTSKPETPPEEAGSTTTEQELDHASILTAQLESGETSEFDAEIIALLEAIEDDPDKSSILRYLIDTGLITLRHIGSKATGLLTGYGTARLATSYVRHLASEYLSDRFLLKASSVKTLASQAASETAGAVQNVASNAATHVDPGALGMFKGAFDALKKGADTVTHGVKDILGTNVVNKGAELIGNAKNSVSDVVGQNLERVTSSANHNIIRPTIDAVSGAFANVTTWVPAGIIGYILGSGAIGGTIAVVQEKRKKNSFAFYEPLMERVMNYPDHENGRDEDENIEDPGAVDQDPRVELIHAFNQILEEPDKSKYHFTKEEWLRFAASVREARVSLLREKTESPDVAIPELTTGLAKQEKIVDDIAWNRFTKQQAGLAEADSNLAADILTQYDRALEKDLSPVERRYAAENTSFKNLARYSKTFVRGGIKATGLPTIWKAVKLGAKVVRKAVLPI